MPGFAQVQYGLSYQYDAAGRLTQRTVTGLATSLQATYVYNAMNRLERVTETVAGFPNTTVAYQYDTPGRLLWKAYGNNDTAEYRCDGESRLSTTNIQLNAYQYVYSQAGQRTFATNSNSHFSEYQYDALGQLASVSGKESIGTMRSQEQSSYAYDKAGNLSQRIRNQLTTSLTVNNNNQLNTAGQSVSLTVAGRVYGSSTPISVTVNDMAANVYSDATFARTNLALPNGATNYTARATNGSATSIDTVRINLPGTVSFQYDDNGNLIRDGQRIMTYDAEDQLVGLVVTDGVYNLTQSGFVYDGLRRLRVRTEASWQGNAWVTNQVVRYVYDGMQVLQEQDGSNQAQVTYTRGLDLSGSFSGAGGIGGLLARSHHSGQTTNHFYYYADGNGNVATLLNARQTVVAEYQKVLGVTSRH